MQVTCGIFLYSTVLGKFLICHATKAKHTVWSIPKGLRDPGEDSFEAASRELLEETGIHLKELRIRKMYVLPPVKYQKANKILEAFLIVTDTPLQDVKLYCSTYVKDHYPEIDKYRWVETDKLKDIIHEAQAHHIDQIKTLLAPDEIKAQFL